MTNCEDAWAFARMLGLSHPTPPVAFAAVLSAIGHRGVWRVSRLVVLPDYQGIGIGRAMLAAVAEQYPRLRITTSHPAMLRALAADPDWRLAALRRAGYTRQPRAIRARRLSRRRHRRQLRRKMRGDV